MNLYYYNCQERGRSNADISFPYSPPEVYDSVERTGVWERREFETLSLKLTVLTEAELQHSAIPTGRWDRDDC